MKKLFKSIIALTLVFAMILPTMSTFGATNVPYKKTGTVYTINGKSYYQAKTTSEYNGVAKGSEFWIDTNSNVVTKEDTLKKLSQISIFNVGGYDDLLVNAASSAKQATEHYYNAFVAIANEEELGTIIGKVSGTALNLCAGNTLSFSEVAIDVAGEALSVEKIKTTALIGILKVHANNADANLKKLDNLTNKTITDYDSLVSAYTAYAECSASLAAIVFLAGDEITEYKNDTVWDRIGNYLFNVLDGLADSVIPDIEAVNIASDLATGALSAIPLTELALSTKSDSVYSAKKDEIYNSFMQISPNSFETAKKLASSSSNASSTHSAGTYKPTYLEGLNIRSGASTSNSVIGAIAYGTSFVVSEVNGNWGKTTCNGKTGWVCLDYATPVNPVNDTQNPIDTSSNMNIEVFNEKLNKFKEKYPHGSKYINNPSKTGGYECFGFANELGVDIFGSYPTDSMSAANVNSTWTVTYGGEAVDTLCVGDIVRYHYHSIFITKIVDDTIYYCEALGDLNNKVQWEQSISRKTLKKYVSEKLTSANTNKTGWVAHYKNGLSCETAQDTNTENSEIDIPQYESIPEGTYIINSTVNDYRYLTAKTDSNGGQVQAKPFENIKAQKFKIVKCENGYQLICQGSASQRVVNVYRDGTSKNGDNVTLWSSTKSGTQIWTFENNGNSYIIRPSDNKNIALTAGDSGKVTVTTYTGASNQIWNLTEENNEINEAEPEIYTVTYNTNGGSSIASQAKTHGVSLTLTSGEPTKSGYTFKGWATSVNGSVAYNAGSAYSADANITLFAVWQPNTYIVTYNTNGGTSVASQTKTHGIPLTLSSVKPTKPDHLFLGWSTTSNGNVEYGSGSDFDIDKNTTLYAIWQKEENEVYYIVYNANGGQNAPSMQTKNKDEDISISDVIPAREGYVFKGWATESNGLVEYNANDTYKGNKTLYLHAVWEAKSYKISYNAAGGKNAPSNQNKIHDEYLVLSDIIPVKDGFVFVNWFDGSDVYNPGTVFEKNADTTLTAVWEKEQEEQEFPFIDVPEDAWYKNDVLNAYNKGIVNGKGENRYAPEDNMTYAEAIKIACTIYQLYHNGEVTLKNGSDVWYSTFMEFATENGIIRSDYSAVANKKITRKDFVNIFYSALPAKEFKKINTIDDNAIPDVKIGDAYSGEIYTFYRAGILTGSDSKGSFMPDSNIKRNEVSAIVTRMLDNGARKVLL